MSIRKTAFVPSEFYHIFNRGNSKQKIFHDPEDYLRFIGLLFVCNSEKNFKIFNLPKEFSLYDVERGHQLVSIGAYCLMPNHFHLLLTPKAPENISIFMKKVCTAYVMYYNKKYRRVGGLFEGKFKAEHIDNDRYLKYIFSYIHLNPLKLIQKESKNKNLLNEVVALKYLKKYFYSSYLDYKNITRMQNKILDCGAFPNYFTTQKLFTREIFDWLNYRIARKDLARDTREN